MPFSNQITVPEMHTATSDAQAELAPQPVQLPAKSSSGPRYIREFDGLRGLSIGMVILYHCWAYQGSGIAGNIVQRLSIMGWCGVDVFFVLSGFLITGILLDTRESDNYWRSFFIRRGLRIFPLYYAVLIILLVNSWVLTR